MSAFQDLPTLKNISPSYLYVQYQDDEALQAFVDAENSMAQGYLDWFNNTPLPIYTDSAISGQLLDWVGLGLYGIKRPVLPISRHAIIGPFDSYTPDAVPFNSSGGGPTGAFYTVNDDIYKRVITWFFYKGDGFQFSVEWLKRRVLRFLNGANGTAPIIDNTYQVSVTFSGTNTVNIGILPGVRQVTGGAIPGRMGLGSVAPGTIQSTFIDLGVSSALTAFSAGVSSGVLQLPFQFQFVVST